MALELRSSSVKQVAIRFDVNNRSGVLSFSPLISATQLVKCVTKTVD